MVLVDEPGEMFDEGVESFVIFQRLGEVAGLDLQLDGLAQK